MFAVRWRAVAFRTAVSVFFFFGGVAYSWPGPPLPPLMVVQFLALALAPALALLLVFAPLLVLFLVFATLLVLVVFLVSSRGLYRGVCLSPRSLPSSKWYS